MCVDSKKERSSVSKNMEEAELYHTLTTLSKRVKQFSIQTRFMAEKDSWPPEQLKAFIPLLFIHYQGHRTPEQVIGMAELMHSGDIGKLKAASEKNSDGQIEGLFDTSKTTKEIQEILAPLEERNSPSFILIEGAPGIGKSILLKEIAYRWGTNQVLRKFELVLLVILRDPSLHEITTIDDLLLSFCIGDKNATKIASACSEYLFETSGKSLTILLDGYDEYPENLRNEKDSLIANILNRRVLPLCGLILSSRPHASECFHDFATIRVDVLGFTETERQQYIEQALPNQPHKIKKITQYLSHQPSIDSICFIPFNMVILLYLYKLGICLPKNSTELYHHFICSTICRHLYRFGNNPYKHSVTSLTNLPEPYNGVIKQLSRLSLDALDNNKLTFTLDEIKTACPGITTIPGAINGFGLLQAVQHFGFYAKTMTLNFLHFTIQEFLAAHYISHLSKNEELTVIKERFWDHIHFNMFSIYISLTKGQRPALKEFLSDGNETITISHKFLSDPLKCLRLYYCFNEADNHALCNTIEQAETFHEKTIMLGFITLTASDIECLSLFLTSLFSKEWSQLVLLNCYIQDKELNILHHRLCHSSNITISKLWFESNGLTAKSSYLISEFTVNCKVKLLGINGNHTIGENQQLYSMLSDPSSVLEELYMVNIKLSSIGAVNLFGALKNNNKLKELHLAHNAITDDACDVMIAVLENNSGLVRMSIYDNPLSSEAIINIVKCLQVNNTMKLLELPDCPEDIQENVTNLQKHFNEKRKSKGCKVMLDIEFDYDDY